MGLLQDIIHNITGQHPQAAPQAQGHEVGRVLPQMAGMAQRAALPQAQYAQYMNPDGTGGGFGPHNPSQLQVRPQGQFQQQHANLGVSTMPVQGRPNPGAIQLQNSGFGPAGNPQIGAFNRLQSYGHQNPQVQDNGYYFDN